MLLTNVEHIKKNQRLEINSYYLTLLLRVSDLGLTLSW